MKSNAPILLLFLALSACDSDFAADGANPPGETPARIPTANPQAPATNLPGESLGECEAKPTVSVTTADGRDTIASATVDSGNCRVQWCTVARLPDGGASPCNQLQIDPDGSCEVTFVSTSGERQRSSITFTSETNPPFRCRVRDQVREIPRIGLTPQSIVLYFSAPADGGI